MVWGTKAPRQQVAGKILWLSDYEPLDVFAWGNLIRRQMGLQQLREAPVGLLRLAAGLGDVYERTTGRSAPLTRFRLNNLLADVVYDTSTTEAIVGPLPFSVESGTEETLRWL